MQLFVPEGASYVSQGSFLLLPWPNEGGNVFASVYLSACLLVCMSLNSLRQTLFKKCCLGNPFWYISRQKMYCTSLE